MAKIIEHRQIPLDDLVIGKGQARTWDTLKDVDQLAESIETQGLLQPIVVCEAKQMGKWEILEGTATVSRPQGAKARYYHCRNSRSARR